MYRAEDKDQLVIEDFHMLFAGKLDPNNRWVRLSELMPWEKVEEIYLQTMSIETGREAISARIAFGAIFIKESERYTDERIVTALQENPYMQYFLGLHEFHTEPLFDPSMMVHFRKRFPVEEVAKINEYVCTGKWPEEQRNVDRNDDTDHGDEPPAPLCGDGENGAKASKQKGKANRNTSKKKTEHRKKNRGKLLLDATVAPADIKYPTDIDLLNQCRVHLETAVNKLWQHMSHSSHKLPYSAKKARKSYLELAKIKKWSQAKCRKVIGEQLCYIELASGQLQKYASMVPDHEKLFPRWLRDRLSVILWLTANRRKCMITTPIPARIESLAWSSPMSARSSAGNVPTPQNLGRNCIFPWWMATPFWSRPVGAASMRAATSKLPWRITYENSAAIPARCWRKKSKIYQTRSNKLFCSERGVRLSGPPLGRRKASLTDAKIKRQMSKDSCERNAIEGRNGNAKRRFGLDRIFSKLDETARTEAALILLAMNASLRLVRWPAYFFRSLLLPFQFLCSLAGPNS